MISLFPNDQTYTTVVAAIEAGESTVVWQINRVLAIAYNPSQAPNPISVISVPAIVGFNPTYLVVNGVSGLAAGLNGQYNFTWNGSSTQNNRNADDLAFQTIVAEAGQVLTVGSNTAGLFTP